MTAHADRNWQASHGIASCPLPPHAQIDGLGDEALMAAHAAGHPDALAVLFGRYAQPLLRLMLRDLRAREDARDLVQQTFLQMHRARADYDPALRLRPWLYTIALNVKREYLRSRARKPTVSLESKLADAVIAEEVSPERRGVASAVRAAVAALPPEQREVIELHWLDGLSFHEVADCLGITANAARVRAHRGYTHLRISLAE